MENWQKEKKSEMNMWLSQLNRNLSNCEVARKKFCSFFGSFKTRKLISYYLRIGSCLACVYRVMDARGKFGEHEKSVRVARGDSREQL